MLDGTKSTIRQFVTAVKGLSKATPHSDALDQPTTHDGFKEQRIGWLEEYLTPGYYDRQNFVDDAETAYKRLNNGRMIVWLNESRIHASFRPRSLLWMSDTLHKRKQSSLVAFCRRTD
jgi:hypothetical protein